MPEEVDLLERFEPLAAAPFAPVTDPGVLRARVSQRRRRRRLATGGLVGLLVVLAVAAAALVGGGGTSGDELRTVAPDTPNRKVPAAYGTGPRLVIETVPDGLASAGCGQQLGEGELASCTFDIPASQGGLGVMVLLRPLPAGAQAVWDGADPKAAATAIGWSSGSPSFVELGGRRVLALGDVGPDNRAFELLLGGHRFQILDQGATDQQIADLVRGLGSEPLDLGFAIPSAALPDEAKVIAQGQQRLWFTPDAQASAGAYENDGRASGITYEVPDVPSYLQVTVVRDVDAESYLDVWADQIRRTEGVTPEPVELAGRAGFHLRARFPGVTGETGAESDRVAVAVDPDTVILVEGSTEIDQQVLDIAGRTTVSAVDPVPAPETSAEPPGEAGWYLPSDLPDGWTLDRGAVDAAGATGNAQLWLTSPSGNLFIVTLRVPSEDAGPSDAATPHAVGGMNRGVWAEPVDDDPAPGTPYEHLVTVRPTAVLEVVLLGTPQGAPPTQQGSAESDELISTLAPVTTDEWRAALRDIPAPPSLLGAATLEALPDGG